MATTRPSMRDLAGVGSGRSRRSHAGRWSCRSPRPQQAADLRRARSSKPGRRSHAFARRSARPSNARRQRHRTGRGSGKVRELNAYNSRSAAILPKPIIESAHSQRNSTRSTRCHGSLLTGARIGLDAGRARHARRADDGGTDHRAAGPCRVAVGGLGHARAPREHGAARRRSAPAVCCCAAIVLAVVLSSASAPAGWSPPTIFPAGASCPGRWCCRCRCRPS